MSYSVKEIFYTLQGEGANTGRPAVFCRFAGCNLWSGREADRAAAVCQFCDTDFVGTDGPGGGKFASADGLAKAVAAAGCVRQAFQPDPACHIAGAAPEAGSGVRLESLTYFKPRRLLVVCTGGEPLLQLDAPLIEAFHDHGLEIAIETNGTLPVPAGIDWVCVSPKAGAELQLVHGDELKLIYPQKGAAPERYAQLDFRHFYLQPMDGPERERNTRLAIDYCLEHPQWRLSLQTHKILGIP